ncbi:MAG: hypothetical protein KJO43_13495, partial [Phycisphaerae bacterium]|nr:hypothetical protein [Phycisphaerae bacterium]
TGPGIETASTTTLTNTDYLLGNLGTIGGGVLDGHVDTNTIIWSGHSRGGEGVVRAYDRLFEGGFSPSNYTIDDIVLVSSISPTDFGGIGAAIAQPHAVDYHLIYGSADGDVSGSPGLACCQPFRIYERAEQWKSEHYVQGADHNDFNCCGFNDFTGPAGTQIGRPEAQAVAKAAYLALVQNRIRGSLAGKDFLTRQYDDLRPGGVSSTTIVDVEYNDGPGAGNFIVDSFQSQTSTAISSSGGAVSGTVTNRLENRMRDGNTSLSWTASDPWNGMTRALASDVTRGTVFDWNTDSFLEFEIIASERDLTDDKNLSFRACQGTRHPNTVSELDDMTFTVTLRDGSGTTSSINIGAYDAGIEEPYQRTGSGSGAGWANEFEVVRIRLTDFLNNGSGLDLGDVVAIRFEFGATYGSAKGRLGLDDIEITQD